MSKPEETQQKGRFSHYVVWVGHRPGIYLSWAACKTQTAGYPGARFKGFHGPEEAQEAYDNHFGNWQPNRLTVTGADRDPAQPPSPDGPESSPDNRAFGDLQAFFGPSQTGSDSSEPGLEDMIKSLFERGERAGLRPYNILYRNAGWAIQWYRMGTTSEMVVFKYYPTLTAALLGEPDRAIEEQ